MESTTFHFAPTEKYSAMTVAVTVGLGPPLPGLMELADEVVTAACEGIIEAAEMLELGITLSLIDVKLDDDATTDGVEAAAFMAVATFAGQAAQFIPVLVLGSRGPFWLVRDERPYPGPDLPAAWIRRPWRHDEDPAQWSAMLTHHRIAADAAPDLYRSASGVLWRQTGVYSGSPIHRRFPRSMYVVLTSDDPDATLRENEILLPVDDV